MIDLIGESSNESHKPNSIIIQFQSPLRICDAIVLLSSGQEHAYDTNNNYFDYSALDFHKSRGSDSQGKGVRTTAFVVYDSFGKEPT